MGVGFGERRRNRRLFGRLDGCWGFPAGGDRGAKRQAAAYKSEAGADLGGEHDAQGDGCQCFTQARHDAKADLWLAQADTQRQPGAARERGGAADVRRTGCRGSENLSPDQFNLPLEDAELAQGVLEAAQEKAEAALQRSRGETPHKPAYNRGHLLRVERVIEPASTQCPWPTVQTCEAPLVRS